MKPSVLRSDQRTQGWSQRPTSFVVQLWHRPEGFRAQVRLLVSDNKDSDLCLSLEQLVYYLETQTLKIAADRAEGAIDL